MRTPRLAGLGLVTMATVALAVAGCGDNTTGTSTSSSAGAAAPSAAASADPAAAAKLSQAVEQLDQTSFTLTASSGSGFKMTGSIDAPNGKAAAQLTASGPNAEINVKTILIGQDPFGEAYDTALLLYNTVATGKAPDFHQPVKNSIMTPDNIDALMKAQAEALRIQLAQLDEGTEPSGPGPHSERDAE